MFRKPRDGVNPDTGRPPSPPSSLSVYAKGASNMATKTAPLTPAPNGTSAARNVQARQKSTGKNSSILSFFKKTSPEDALASDPLFVEDRSPRKAPTNDAFYGGLKSAIGTSSTSRYDSDEALRFNESTGSNKRRRLSLEDTESEPPLAGPIMDEAQGACSPPPPDFNDGTNPGLPQESTIKSESDETLLARDAGPFLDESDSDEGNPFLTRAAEQQKSSPDTEAAPSEEAQKSPTRSPVKTEDNEASFQTQNDPPALTRHSTTAPDLDGFAEFEGMEDFDDEYLEGDEFVERRWQREQRRIELEEQGFEGDFDDEDLEGATNDGDQQLLANSAPHRGDAGSSAAECPICSASFAGVSDQEASVHVNHCLDGNPTPLPSRDPKVKLEPQVDASIESMVDQDQPARPKFRGPIRPAKPGQDNPFTLSQANGTSSAFSKLMSGHAEDAAWATAAAAENASRGKPAYQRTCPFYKILPGFNICVDAFRYGAVQGCKAYFLSHFHSDHYIGLTATWSHGPIYCSRPTANLVRQQLRVNPKWLVDLEFEQQVEVPGTNGVQVTMIPANHCPGSSLYLFEKTIGKGQNAKVQRVLHCGDFRACPAHVEHPLLRPDIVDSVSGKTAQQKIDVCYLDTTYLNPKYAFPSQEDVIKACADMCVSMNKTKANSKEDWEQKTIERAGSSMANFVRKNSAAEEDEADSQVDDPDTQAVFQPASKPSTIASKPFKHTGDRLLVVVGTYSIGKERICLGIARALNSKIYAPPGKRRICACLEDPELEARLTSDPRAAQVHMTPLFEIRAETLGDYLAEYHDAFSRAVGFRPSGWNYRPPGSRFTDSPAVATVLFSGNWRSAYGVRDLVPQRGSNARCSTYGVPYSEHSSFRELTMFCCALRIEKVIPTVNVGSAKSRERMKQWVDRWNTFKKKEGLFQVAAADNPGQDDGKGDWYAGNGTWELRTTL